ncbi:MAG: peptidase C39, partial [Synechococcaceae bacterium WB9_2_112]|nr:peptidase C39 [Synechococcaceae bacterium WB9_2_112]
LSALGRERLLSGAVLRAYTTGQPLSSADQISSEVLLLEEGQARLVCRDAGRLSTAEKLMPGAFVGLASLLRAQACEAVTAAGPLQAWAIPDGLLLELLASEPSFASWCQGHLFSAELLALLELLLAKAPRQGVRVVDELPRLRSMARLVEPRPEALASLGADAVLLAASHNLLDHLIGARLDPQAGVPAANPPLPPRLVVVPLEWFAALSESGAGVEPASAPASALVPASAAAPLASSLDLGQRDQRPFRLLRGEGPLEETLACFQMLAAELKLPFRRDAIDKILREALGRGQMPDLQLCGNIAAMMGLHVSGVRVQASQGTRLQTPALLPWKQGFALVRASNAQGLHLASPRDGVVLVAPGELQQAFPDGIEFLLLERRTGTPEQRFDFSWFWPVLKRYRGILSQVLLASFVVQLFSLANPLLIQVIIDKVISQRSLDTLQV